MAAFNLQDMRMALNGSQTKGIFRLPPELRNKIWELSLPDDGKVVQARSHQCHKHKYDIRTKKNCIVCFSVVKQQGNTRPVPAVLQACTEARSIVLFLHGGEEGASGIWWNPAVDKILFDFDFNPRCLEGRTELCAVFKQVAVGISYGALFSIKLSLAPDMRTVRAETGARGQLAKLIKELPEMQTLSIAYPDVPGYDFQDPRNRGHVHLHSSSTSRPAPMTEQEKLRGKPHNMVKVVSFRNPAAVFQAIELLDRWIRQMRVTDATSNRQWSYIFGSTTQLQQMGPPLGEVPFGPLAVKVLTKPAPHLASYSPFYMRHSLDISLQHMRWLFFLLPEIGSPEMRAFLARVTGSPLPGPALLDPLANRNRAFMSGHALLVQAAATNDRSILPKLVNVGNYMYNDMVYRRMLPLLYQDQMIERDALSQAIVNQILSLVRYQLDMDMAAAAVAVNSNSSNNNNNDSNQS